jgi:hypothetical protein
VLEEHFRDRAAAYEPLIFATETVEDAYRLVARSWHDANEREPEWSRLVIEFMAHASRHEGLRQAVKEVRERGLDRIAELVERLAERHGSSTRFRSGSSFAARARSTAAWPWSSCSTPSCRSRRSRRCTSRASAG